jgi:hypothetical protein
MIHYTIIPTGPYFFIDSKCCFLNIVAYINFISHMVHDYLANGNFEVFEQIKKINTRILLGRM